MTDQVKATLCLAYAMAGRVADGLPLLEQAVARDLVAGGALRTTWLGEAYLLASDIPAALAAAHRALEIARGRKERGNEAYALRLLGAIGAHGEPRPPVGAIVR